MPGSSSRSGSGSSPLARGTPGVAVLMSNAVRLIPARAGNTKRSPNPATCRSAHPRSRGEHVSVTVWKPRASGSSPLARGTLISTVVTGFGTRLIPARAGNTSATHTVSDKIAAHPRSRGEHWRFFSGTNSPHGSSPLARGTRLDPLVRDGGRRLIPARAGNTNVLHYARIRAPAHPRSRGEHLTWGK